jgi:hypothetical protein
VIVIVHGAVRPSDAEWREVLDRSLHRKPRGLIVFSPKSCPGPTATQRSEAAATWKAIGDRVPMAMVTDSRIIRGMVTAVQWLTKQPATAHAPERVEAACGAVGLDEAACATLRAEAFDMARHLGVEDELGYLAPHSVAV